MRIVSLLPSTTEIVYSLGKGDELVGVTFECDYPPQARSVRVVSNSALPEGLSLAEIDRIVSEKMRAGHDLYTLDAGALAELDADLVLTQDLCAVCAVDVSEVNDALAHLGCTAAVLTLDPGTLDEVLESILTVGQSINASACAEELVRSLRARLDAVGLSVAGASRPSMAVLEWTDPPFSPGHWLPDMIDVAGATALLGSAGAKSHRLTWDEVNAARPDIVVIAPCGFGLDAATEIGRAALDHLDAPTVWAVDANASYARPGPRLVDGTEALAAIAHPELGAPSPGIASRLR